MVGFVNDTELLSMAQHDSQLWSDLLHQLGRALELAKSKYHTISYSLRSRTVVQFPISAVFFWHFKKVRAYVPSLGRNLPSYVYVE
jgi:hypothetical protein